MAWPPTLDEAERFQVSTGRPGVVIGVPEGMPDAGTDQVGHDLARLTRFGAVVATWPSRRRGDRPLERDHGGTGDPGPAAVLEGQTVDVAYRRLVGEAAQGPLELYVEVRGDGGAVPSGRVEIATRGLSREETWGLKTLFELIRDARVDARAVPRLEVRVEPSDSLPATASAVPPPGPLVWPRRALRIELPLPARTTYREIYTELLGDFLVQSAAFLLPRVR